MLFQGKQRSLIVLTLAAVTGGGVAYADSAGVEPFDAFVSRVAKAQLSELASSNVASASEFEAMRNHILGLYDGVKVQHSFAADGQIYDCVPITQQPTVRQLGLPSIATPPPYAPPGGQPARLQSCAQSRFGASDDLLGSLHSAATR